MTNCSCGGCAHYGYPGSNAICCGLCRKPGMTNVHIRRCHMHECDLMPGFGRPGGRAVACKKHMSPGMVNVVSPKCEICGRQSSFGEPGGTARTRCGKHAESGMVNLSYPRRKVHNSFFVNAKLNPDKAVPLLSKLNPDKAVFTGGKLNPDGTVASWGIPVPSNGTVTVKTIFTGGKLNPDGTVASWGKPCFP
jgi:hypothetical protein